MPTGGAVLTALLVALAAGTNDGALAALGLRRRVCLAWGLAALAASAINLPLPPVRPVVLCNPGGTLVPLGFAAFILLNERGRRDWAPAGVAALAAGLALAAMGVWHEQTGGRWPGLIAGAVAVSASAAGLGRTPRAALAGVCSALAVGAGLRAVAAVVLGAPWPASLGGGADFEIGILGVVGTVAALRVAAFARARQPGARAAAELRPTAR